MGSLNVADHYQQQRTIHEESKNFMQNQDSPKEDSFIVDIENLSHHHHHHHPQQQQGTTYSKMTVGTIDRDVTPRTAMQRSLSRKGTSSFRNGGGERNSITLASSAVVATGDDISNAFTIGGCISDKPNIVASVGGSGVGTSELTQTQPTITITAESRSRRHINLRPSAWNMDPRRIVLFFATLSSMGTILLIYFTLSISKFSGEDESA